MDRRSRQEDSSTTDFGLERLFDERRHRATPFTRLRRTIHRTIQPAIAQIRDRFRPTHRRRTNVKSAYANADARGERLRQWVMSVDPGMEQADLSTGRFGKLKKRFVSAGRSVQPVFDLFRRLDHQDVSDALRSATHTLNRVNDLLVSIGEQMKNERRAIRQRYGLQTSQLIDDMYNLYANVEDSYDACQIELRAIREEIDHQTSTLTITQMRRTFPNFLRRIKRVEKKASKDEAALIMLENNMNTLRSETLDEQSEMRVPEQLEDQNVRKVQKRVARLRKAQANREGIEERFREELIDVTDTDSLLEKVDHITFRFGEFDRLYAKVKENLKKLRAYVISWIKEEKSEAVLRELKAIELYTNQVDSFNQRVQDAYRQMKIIRNSANLTSSAGTLRSELNEMVESMNAMIEMLAQYFQQLQQTNEIISKKYAEWLREEVQDQSSSATDSRGSKRARFDLAYSSDEDDESYFQRPQTRPSGESESSTLKGSSVTLQPGTSQEKSTAAQSSSFDFLRPFQRNFVGSFRSLGSEPPARRPPSDSLSLPPEL